MVAIVKAEESSTHFSKSNYIEALSRIERLHRRLLAVITNELEGQGWREELSPVQALLLFNVGGRDLAAHQMRSQGYFLGTSVSFNVRRLLAGGFVTRDRSLGDRRSSRIRLTTKGFKAAQMIGDLYSRHLNSLEKVGELDAGALGSINSTLRKLESFFGATLDDRIRPTRAALRTSSAAELVMR
jgi:DNA-binding MarR family transcriptional regulator